LLYDYFVQHKPAGPVLFMSVSFLSSKLIYAAVEPHDEEYPEYNCYRPVDSGRYFMLDCWVCDEQGNVHPEYNACGVPVRAENIGEAVADYEADY
jgi:hypothetical protein